MIQIRLTNISKVYGSGASAARAVDDVSILVDRGELFFLLGPSGCGKTTLLRIIAGLVEPTSGRLFFDDKDVTSLSVERRNTAMVFQSYALWPHMTVEHNVEFGPRMRGVGRAMRRELVSANLSRVEMTGYEKRKPGQLSGGQQQRVALARALAAQGKCLLLDEPLSNLDARLRLHMRVELRRLVKETGVTAIYVTHDQAEALSMADRIAVMEAGRIVQTGAPEELYSRPRTRFVADFLGEANFITGTLAAMGQTFAVQTALGPIATAPAARPNVPVGAAVTCCVRPERVAFADGAASGGLVATVAGVTYLGGSRQVQCRLADGGTWRVVCPAGAGEDIRPGRQVRLVVRPADVIVLLE